MGNISYLIKRLGLVSYGGVHYNVGEIKPRLRFNRSKINGECAAQRSVRVVQMKESSDELFNIEDLMDKSSALPPLTPHCVLLDRTDVL